MLDETFSFDKLENEGEITTPALKNFIEALKRPRIKKRKSSGRYHIRDDANHLQYHI